MKHFFFRLALVVTAFFPVSSVLAADLDVPPPIEDLRPTNFDWSGPYVGAFVAGITETGTYDAVCVPAACTGLREMNGLAGMVAPLSAGITRSTALSWVWKVIGPLVAT